MEEQSPIFRRAGEEDFPAIAELLRQRDKNPDLLDSLQWKYLKCPDGSGQIFVAETPDGSIVGMTAYLPRRFTSKGTGAFSLMQGVDAFVPKALRAKGIYSGIVALARQEMNVPKIAFPNQLSIGFGVKFGWQVLSPLRIWRFPVAPGSLLSTGRFRFLSPIANALSRLYASCWTGPVPKDLRMEAVRRFQRDYTDEGDRIQGIRSADYLNWRFVDNPMRTYYAYEFMEGDDPIGYCVYAKNDLSVEIFDLVTIRRRRQCFRLLLEQCRRERTSHVSFRGVHLRAARLGFLPGGTSRKCIVFKAPRGRWMINMCDSDW
jgi:hypothetical protein